jgi:hypothetical protein
MRGIEVGGARTAIPALGFGLQQPYAINKALVEAHSNPQLHRVEASKLFLLQFGCIPHNDVCRLRRRPPPGNQVR